MTSDFIEKAYQSLYKLLGLPRAFLLKSVNFDQPWWSILWAFKLKLLFVLILRSIFEIVTTLLPLFIAYAVGTGNYQTYLLALAIMGALVVEGVLMELNYTRLQASVINSVFESANRYFLSVDPIHHATRSSGQIISKVTRGANSFEPLMDTFVYEFWRIIVGILTVAGALWVFSPMLGLLGAGIMLVILMLASLTNGLVVRRIASKRIGDEDKLKAITVSNLQEVLHIRSSFATQQQVQAAQDQSNQVAKTQIATWMMQTMVFQLSWIVYIMGLALVGYIIFNLLNTGQIQSITAVALLATFVEGSGRLLWMGGRIGRFIEKLNDIRDMFAFIRGFGEQTYPVLHSGQKD